MVNVMEIDPNDVYSISEAARLIPSCQAGKVLNLATLHRWRAQGKLKAQRSPGRGWYVFGSELLRMLAADQIPVCKGMTPAPRKRAHEQTMAELKRLAVFIVLAAARLFRGQMLFQNQGLRQRYLATVRKGWPTRRTPSRGSGADVGGDCGGGHGDTVSNAPASWAINNLGVFLPLGRRQPLDHVFGRY